MLLVLIGVFCGWFALLLSQVDDSDPVEELSEAATKRKEVVGKFNRHAR